jgi:hypothetical protein
VTVIPYKVPKFQSSKVSGFQGFKVSRFQGFKVSGSKVRRFEIPRFEGSAVPFRCEPSNPGTSNLASLKPETLEPSIVYR